MKQSKSSMIVITGVTKGLGRALCKGFNELGHTVVGCGSSLNEIEQLNQLY